MSQNPTDDRGTIRRIVEAIPRFVFHVDVSSVPSSNIADYLKRIKRRLHDRNTPLKEFTERVFADEEWTDEEIDRWNRRFRGLDFRWNPLKNDENFWLPQRV
jgi:hypothetical protein